MNELLFVVVRIDAEKLYNFNGMNFALSLSKSVIEWNVVL